MPLKEWDRSRGASAVREIDEIAPDYGQNASPTRKGAATGELVGQRTVSLGVTTGTACLTKLMDWVGRLHSAIIRCLDRRLLWGDMTPFHQGSTRQT